MQGKNERIFQEQFILNLSFFNFKNAVTATFFCDQDLRIKKVNANFKQIFPQIESFDGASLTHLLNTLGVASETLIEITGKLKTEGKMHIPELYVEAENNKKMFSFLATRTEHKLFPFLNGVQGQLIDRTEEFRLKQKNEVLILELEETNRALDEKGNRLSSIAERLAKYLSPQVYKNLFSKENAEEQKYNRKYLTIFFSDIKDFTKLSDRLEPERLAELINGYLSDMAKIAIEFGGTIDKFVGDAVMVFFGDPETTGADNDAFKCVSMAFEMRKKIEALNNLWQEKFRIPEGLSVRMGIASGFCTVGNFGSSQKMDYTILGSPVNLAARLQGLCVPRDILLSAETYSLLKSAVECTEQEASKVKGFQFPITYYRLKKIIDENRISTLEARYETENIDIWVKRPEEVRTVLAELKQIQEKFELKLADDKER